VIYDLKPIAKKKKLDILFEIDKIEGSRSQKGKIIGDAWLLTMAVYNLVDNAIRYSKSESKPIKVDLKYQIDSWVLSVQDDGIGISPLDMQKNIRGADFFYGGI
jgi:signal transduction histidine kinase